MRSPDEGRYRSDALTDRLDDVVRTERLDQALVLRVVLVKRTDIDIKLSHLLNTDISV